MSHAGADFSDIDEFVKDKAGSSKASDDFGDIDTFVAGQSKSASAEAPKSKEVQDWEDTVQKGAISSIPKPAFMSGEPRAVDVLPGPFGFEEDEGGIAPVAKTPPLQPYDWQRGLVGGVTDILTNQGMPGAAQPSSGEDMARHVREMETPGKRMQGLLGTAATATEAATPIMGVGALQTGEAIANAPNLLSALLPAVKGLGAMAAGAGASKVAGDLAQKAGMTPDEVESIRTLAFWAPNLAAAIMQPKFGAARTPNETIIRAGVKAPIVGEVAGEVRIPRKGPAAPPDMLDEPIPNAQSPWEAAKGNLQPRTPLPPSTDPAAQAAQAMVEHEAATQRAARAVQGVPEPQAPAPPPVHEVTPEAVAKVADAIQTLPPEMRAEAIKEMHGQMAQQLLHQSKGKVIGPDGKLEIIRNLNDAERVVQGWINTEVDRHDKAAEEKNKAAAIENTNGSKSGKAAEVPQPNLAENPIVKAKALPKPSFGDVDQFVKENASEGKGPGNHDARGAALSGTEHPTSTTAEENRSEDVARTGREAFTRGDRVEMADGRKGRILWASPKDPIVRIEVDGGGKVSKGVSTLKRVESANGKQESNGSASANIEGPGETGTREAGAAGAGPDAGNRGPAAAAAGTADSGGEEALSAAPAAGSEAPKKYKYGNTQAPIPEGSEAHQAIESARGRISPEDLAGDGTDVGGGNHVTVRYGVKGDAERIKSFLSAQKPFEATLGKTAVFPPSESSDGAAVVHAPVESDELHRLNAEIEEHGDFAPSSHPEYKPHATIAYVKAEKAGRYKGMSVTHGKKFTVSHVAISKQDGTTELVKLEGRSERRKNLAQRKRVAEMSPEELRKELLSSPVTDLPNKRAFEESEHAQKAKSVAMSDADGLKALNDKFGYDAGNELLRAKAEALTQAGLDAYHEKGDEFLYRGESPEALQSKLEKARQILRNRVIEVEMKDGSVKRFKGADFSYGTGSDLTSAESGLKQHKSEREARGERARGELRGITELGPEKSVEGKSAASPAKVAAPPTPPSNVERFREVYTRNLEREIQKHPDDYAYPKSEVPRVVDRMIAALQRGSANRTTPAIKNTLKELGIKPGHEDVKKFLAAADVTRVTSAPSAPPESKYVEVPAERVSMGSFDQRTQRTTGEGDISRAYSGDKIGLSGGLRGVVDIGGKKYTNVGGAPGGMTTLVRVFTPEEWGDRPVAPKRQASPENGYEGIKVTYKAKPYILGGRADEVLAYPKGSSKFGSEGPEPVSKEPFALQPPPNDVGVKQWIKELPENQQQYAQKVWDVFKEKGAPSKLDVLPGEDLATFVNNQVGAPSFDEDEMDDILDHLRGLAHGYRAEAPAPQTKLSDEAELRDASNQTLEERRKQLLAAMERNKDAPGFGKTAVEKEIKRIEKEQAYRIKHPMSFRGEIPPAENEELTPGVESTRESGTDTAERGRTLRPAESDGGDKLAGAPEALRPQAGEGESARPGLGRSGGERHPDNEPGSSQGLEPGSPEGTGLRQPAAAGSRSLKPTKTATRNPDWFAHPDDFSVDATDSQRLEWNMKALKTLERVLKAGEKLTDDDRDALAHYVGWGALQDVFDPHRSYDTPRRVLEANRELQTLMTPEEFAAARRSTQNAHYTSPQLVRFIWSALQKMGFKGGQILEPSMGTGNFFGMMPKSIRGQSQGIGNELDPTTYNIARLLYPSATTFNKDFVELMMPHDSIDLAVSNVPFGVQVYDKNYPKLKAPIHDYFFVKSLDKVRPGGMVAFVTSTFTLDKQRPDIREILADKGELLYALRLPQDTFGKSAGTAVATDVIFMRKRLPGEESKGEPFISTRDTQARFAPEIGRDGFGTQPINEYYLKHPENVLGDLQIGRGRTTANPETLVIKRTSDFEDKLKAALDRVPRNGFLSKRSAAPLMRANMDEAFASDDLQEGDFTVHNGEIMQRREGKLKPTDAVLDKDGKPSRMLVDRVKRLLEIRSGVRDLLRSGRELPDDAASNKLMEKARLKLAIKVKEYYRDHGLFNDRRTKQVFADDSSYPLILSLEHYDKATKKGTPADILRERTTYPEARLDSLSADPKEALYQTLGERGRPDIEYMSQMLGKPEAEIAKPLLQEGIIFREPVTGMYVTRVKYLSGYVRDKLRDAKKAVAQGNKEFEANVRELEKIQPATIPINSGDPKRDIKLKLGATYIKPATIADFIGEVFKAPGTEVKNVLGNWGIDYMRQTAQSMGEFGGGGMDGKTLLEQALNLKSPVVKDNIPGGPGESDREVVNQEKTIAAKRAQQKIKDAFGKWAREHKKWAPILEHEYNELFNGLVEPDRDGSHLTFPGMNKSILRDGKLAPHQSDAVWMQIEEGRGLLAHVVGAGKTFEMITGVMELKRLGRIRKALVTVPNHLVGQWGADWLRLYPGSKILVPGKDDFDATRRNRTMSRIATGNWDAVLLPHSQFDLMDISPERQLVTLTKDFEELEETYRAAKMKEGGKGYTVKRLEKAKDRLKARMDELRDLKADKTIRFDDLGVDHLVVDEAHRYKNLAFYTKMDRVAGLAQGDSKRATRLKMKTDYLLEKHNNRGVVFATGTPVQNTMAEMYNMTRYVAPDALEKAGIRYFDDWAANFGDIITSMELGVDGRTYKPRSKFAKFVNVPELQMIFRSFADVRTKEDLQLPVPEIEGGKPQALTARPTPELEQYVASLVERAQRCRGEGGSRPDPRVDNMLKVTSDGRKAATDLRLIDNNYPDDPSSKINKVVDKIFEEWLSGKEDPAVIDPATGKALKNLTGAVFLDNYQYIEEVGAQYSPEGKVTKKGIEKVLLNLYRDMADKLVARGVPREHIAIIHDYPKQEQKLDLFGKMNRGDIRVLFGSTEKMGAGMNAQERMKYLIDVDSPWRPGDLEQRHGRIIRQGNKNKSVRLYHAVTKGTFDSYMMQTLKTKAEFIQQVMTGRNKEREILDMAGEMVLSLEEMLAASSDNPDVKRNMELQAEIAGLEVVEREHLAQQKRNVREASYSRDKASYQEQQIEAWTKIQKDWEKATAGDKFECRILGKTFTKYGDVNDWIKDQNAPAVPFHWEINGIPLRFEMMKLALESDLAMGYYVGPFSYPRRIDGFSSLVTSAYSYLAPNHVKSRIEAAEQEKKVLDAKADDLEKLSKSSQFEDAARLAEAKKELAAVRKRLGIDDDKSIAEQEVAADVDSSPETPVPVDEEEETPQDNALRRLLKEETGELNVTALKNAVSELYKQDVEKVLTRTTLTLREIPAFAIRALYPRIEQSNPVGRALGVAAPSDAVDALMKVQGDRAKAIAEFELVLKGTRKFFDRMPEEGRIDFIDRMQNGQKQRTTDLDDLAEMFRKIMDGQRQVEEDALNLGRRGGQLLQLSRKENYFHNWWDIRPGSDSDQEDEHDRLGRMFTPRRPFEGTKGYNKRQSYTLKSGMEAGGEPMTTNPVTLLQHRLEDGMKYVTARQAWHETKQLDLRKYVRTGQRPPAGFEKVDDKIARVYFPAELEFPGMEEPTKVPHQIGEWYVEANTARLLNNMLSVDKIRANPVGRGLMALKNLSTALELGLSPFHAVFESIEAMSSQLSLGIGRAYNQGLRQAKPDQLLQGMKEILSSPAAPILLAREGAALPAYIEARARLGKIGLTQYGHVIAGSQPHGVLDAIQQFREVRKDKAVQRLLKQYPDLDQFVDDMFQGGLVIGQHRDYQLRRLGKTMTEAWNSNNPLGAVWRAIPTIGQGIMYPLFNVYIPNLKYSLFLQMMSEQVGEHSRELAEGSLTRATLARRVADSVENRFGELNFDNLFLNRSVKTALQFIFRSATYKMGTGREIVGAVGGQSHELTTWAKDAYSLLSGGSGSGGGGGKGIFDGFNPDEAGEGEEPNEKTVGEKVLPRLDIRASWVLSLLITTAMLAIVAAKLLSKKYPWQWIGEDEDEGLSASDAAYLEFTHPRTGERDSRGKPVRISLPTYIKEIEHAVSDPGRYVVGSLSSILSRGMDVAKNEDYFGNYVYNPNDSLGKKAEQVGRYVAPVPFVASNFERGRQQGQMTTAWLSAFGFPKAPADLDFTPAEKLARKLIPHRPETPEELEAWREKRQAIEDGTASKQETKKWLERQRFTWLQRQVRSRDMSYGQALDVWDVANDGERAELHKILEQKRKSALRGEGRAQVAELEQEHER